MCEISLYPLLVIEMREILVVELMAAVKQPGHGLHVLRVETAAVRKTLLRISSSDLKRLFAISCQRWCQHNAPRMGAALAYYALLSLMPLLLVIISVAGLVLGAKAAETGVIQQLQYLMGGQRANILEALLEGAQNRAEGIVATFIGMAALIFGASGVLVELRDTLNIIWGTPIRRMSTFHGIVGLVKERLWSLALVLGIVAALTASLLFSTVITAIGSFTPALPQHQIVLHLLNTLLSFVGTTIVFAAIYRVVPQVPIKWRDVILGAAVTAILFALGNVLLGLYLGKASFSSTYGAASSVVVLAIWIYYSSQIFFLGAEFTKAYAETYGSTSKEKRPRSPESAA
jgi:membrane protein